MPFNGSAGAKTFSRTTGFFSGPTTWAQTKAGGRDILETDLDVHDQDIAAALGTSWQTNGDTTPSVDLPMGTHKFTGMKAGSANGDSIRYEQVAAIPDLVMAGGYLVATVNASALTVAVKYSDGTDPSAANPVTFNFRDPVQTSGARVIRALQSALNLTISSGSTMGVIAAVPFDLEVVIINDGGTLRLGLINSPISRIADDGVMLATAEGGGGGADSSGVVYAASTILTLAAYRVIGRLRWASGLVTPGAWVTVPTSVHSSPNSVAAAVPGTVFLQAGTLVGASVDIVLKNYTIYRGLKLFIYGAVPTVDNANIRMKMSTDGGATFDQTGYSTVLSVASDNTNITNSGNSGASCAGINLSHDLGSAATQGGNAEITFLGQALTALWSRIHFIGSGYNASNVCHVSKGSGGRRTAQDTDAIRLEWTTSASFASGNYALYGLT